jgi:3-oxoacyl-[acyl-carrier protein] reductase
MADAPRELEGKCALVTGASRGIGRAIALELGRMGAKVAGTATTVEGAAAIDAYMKEIGIAGRGMVMNVTDVQQIEQAVASIQAELGEIAILVNNAGITKDNLLMRMREEEWDVVLDTDLKSAYRLSKIVLRPMMKARFGRIVNVSSVVGSMGNAGQVNYCAAKAGLTGFTKALAREVGSRGITVNCVAPGFIDTDMTRALSEAQRNAMLAHIPLERFGDVAEVAACVGFLASRHAGYVTGSTLHVNGGMYMD